MCAWGSNGGITSCESLVKRVEQNDPTLVELILLPMKKLTATDMDRISKALEGKNTNLRSIQASGHSLPSKSLNIFGESIAKGLSNLQNLAIGDQSMGDDGCRALCQGLTQQPCQSTLKSLDLSYKGLGSDSWITFLQMAQSCQNLTSLNVSLNPGILNLAAPQKIPDGLANIVDLDLGGCEISEEACVSLCERLEGVSKIRLSNNPIGAAACKVLNLSTVEEVQMIDCQIGNVPLQITTETSEIRVLNLSSNDLRGGAVQALCEALRGSLPCLSSLDLSSNANLGKHLELVGALATRHELGHTCLDTFDLSHSGCSVEGAGAALEKSQVRNLRLFDNSLGSQGFRKLSLKGGHPFLSSVDLGGNHADEASVVYLLSGLLESSTFESTLSTVIVGGNQGGEELEDICQQIALKWPKLDIARDKIKKSTC